MVYRGHVQGGVVIIDDAVALPDGIQVRVEVAPLGASTPEVGQGEPTLGQKLLKYAGKAVGLPADAARNHDHYLYGTPKL